MNLISEMPQVPGVWPNKRKIDSVNHTTDSKNHTAQK